MSDYQTPEQLEDKQKELLDQLESQEENSEEKPPEKPEDTPVEEEEKLEAPQEDIQEQKEEKQEVSSEQEENQEQEKDVSEKDVDWKKKFSESSRESQVIASGKKLLEKEIDEAQNMPQPTDEEVKAEVQKYGEEYEDMSPFLKEMAKDRLHQKMINEKVREIREKHRADEEKIATRQKEADVFSIHPDTLKKFPRLEGKQEQFIKFASKPTRLALDLEDVTRLFLLDIPEKPKNKGQMFETGDNRGIKPKPKNNKLSVEEGAILREKNYNLYREKLTRGEIATDID